MSSRLASQAGLWTCLDRETFLRRRAISAFALLALLQIYLVKKVIAPGEAKYGGTGSLVEVASRVHHQDGLGV